MHIICSFIMLACIFSGVHSNGVIIYSSFLTYFIVRILARLLILCDIFILSLYPISLPMWCVLIMADCCLWGILARSALSACTSPIKPLWFILICLLGIIYLACISTFFEIAFFNTRRSLSRLRLKLPFTAKLIESNAELRHAFTVYLISLTELTASSVIYAHISA